MYVLKHKLKATFIFKGPNEVQLQDIDNCSTYTNLTEARQALNAYKTRSYLTQNGEKPEDFEAVPVKLQLQ